ncbi:response regulator [Psychroflexus aestuariivivens]|uniref:response regulator n=1 Tax=Psychroflexus aestuariivivens TaxID=1795040 RepID=UPI000FD97AE9|nr:response regulator transcription factor [Psychroflexus aestuariivivens]
MIRLVIAEDHQSFVDGLRLLLDNEENITVVGSANNGEDLLDILEKKSVNVVLTDIKMPKIDGIAACRLIKKSHPQVKVIALTMFDQDDAVKQMLDAGCDGYLLKNSSLKLVLNALETVASGGQFFDPTICIDDLETESHGKQILTNSEFEILKLISLGKTSREIADIRSTAISTVERHRKNMIGKLKLKGANELLRYALDKKYNFDV